MCIHACVHTRATCMCVHTHMRAPVQHGCIYMHVYVYLCNMYACTYTCGMYKSASSFSSWSVCWAGYPSGTCPVLPPSHSSPRTAAPLSVLFVEGAKVKTNESAEATQLGRDIASTGARWSPVDVLKQHSHQARKVWYRCLW